MLRATMLLCGVGAVGAAGYGYYLNNVVAAQANSLFLDEVPMRFKSVPTNIETSPGRILLAYHMDAKLSTAKAVQDIYGTQAAMYGSYIRSDGAKVVKSKTKKSDEIPTLGALYAFQALENSMPLRGWLAMRQFFHTWRLTDIYLILRNTNANFMHTAREKMIEDRSADNLKGVPAKVDQYCKAHSEMGYEPRDVKLFAENKEACVVYGPNSDAPVKVTVALGDALDPNEQPHGVRLYTFFQIPALAMEPGMWNRVEKAYWEFYCRWATVGIVKALGKI